MFGKVLGVLFAFAVAACLMIAAFPQLFGLELAPIIAQVVALRVGVVMIALVLAVFFALLLFAPKLRAFAGSIVALLVLFSLVSAGVQASRGIANAEIESQAGDVTVLTWNTFGDSPGVDVIAQLITDTGADIVALPETTGPFATEIAVRLREAGTPYWAHTTRFAPDYGALSTSLLISAELGEYTTDLEVGQTRTLPTIVARPDSGEGPVIVATHPVAPIPQQMRNWRADLEFVAELCNSNDNVIIGGDFNSTLDHWPSFAGEGDLGACRDAASRSGSGGLGTWPTLAPSWLGSPIDHVVASDQWEPVSSQVLEGYDDYATDHRPLVAVLRPAQ